MEKKKKKNLSTFHAKHHNPLVKNIFFKNVKSRKLTFK